MPVTVGPGPAFKLVGQQGPPGPTRRLRPAAGPTPSPSAPTLKETACHRNITVQSQWSMMEAQCGMRFHRLGPLGRGSLGGLSL